VADQRASMLIADLSKVPNIVGGLGLSIAAAQKALNLDYLETLEGVIGLACLLLAGKGADGKDLSEEQAKRLAEARPFLADLVKSLAPSRYQFTETTLAVRLDLAQTKSLDVSVGLGVGYNGIAVNASLAVGYRYDYRAAAEVRAVLHAIPADPQILQVLIQRAATLSEKALELPPRTEVDQRLIDQSRTVFEKFVGVTPLAVKDAQPATVPAPAQPH
jgi:hypothetical protein